MSRSLEKIETPIAKEIRSFETPDLEPSPKIKLDQIPSLERVLANHCIRVLRESRVRLFIALEAWADDE
jgi:hypothetical protein